MNHPPYLRLAAAIVLLAPLLAGLRREPADRRRAAAAAGGDGGQAGRAQRHRPRRICRPLRRGRFGRGPRARLGLSRQHPFHGRPDRQAGRPAVHHRPAAVPERARQARANLAQARANLAFAEADLDARASSSCATSTITRADLRPAHAGHPQRARPRSQPTRRRCARPSSISSSPSCARRSPAASATGASRAGNLVTGGTGRHHDAARHHRLDRSDPLRVHHR